MQDKLKDYKIIKLLGKGSFGKVYLQEKDNIKYVVKYINIDSTNITDIYSRIDALKKYNESIYLEVEALKKISKYNNCKSISSSNNSFMCLIDSFPIYDDKDGKYKYVIITNYLENTVTLKELIYNNMINNKTFEFSDIIFLMSRLISQLQQMHENHLVHGDIKPDNIIVQNKNGKIKNVIYIDFGTTCSKLCLPNGTLFYIAPELVQVLGNKEREDLLKRKVKNPLDHIPISIKEYMKTDVFSLGIVFYEMLNNRYPYPNKRDYIIQEMSKYDKESQLKKITNTNNYNNNNSVTDSNSEIMNSDSDSEIINSDSEIMDSDSDSEDEISDKEKYLQYINNNLPKNLVLGKLDLYDFYRKASKIKSYYHGDEKNYNILNEIVESMLIINPMERYSISRIKRKLNKLVISLIANNYFSLGKRNRLISPSISNSL